MAAATEYTLQGYPDRFVSGSRREVVTKLRAPRDGDTYDTGLVNCFAATVTIVLATIRALDYTALNSIRGGVLTFEVSATPRDVFVRAVGY